MTLQAVIRRAFQLIALCALVFATSLLTLTSVKADALDTGGGGISERFVMHAQHALHEGRMTESIEYSNRALAIYPNYMRAIFVRGEAELDAADHAAAIKDFSTVIGSHSEYPLLYFFRGIAHLNQRSPRAALEDFNRAAEAHLGMGQVLAADLLARRSLAFEMLGQSDFAVADLKEALTASEAEEQDWNVLNDHCRSATIIGLLDMAKLTCDESVARHERNIHIYDTRGLLEIKTRAWESAIADYTKSLYYRPDFAPSLYGRAVARHAKGDLAGEAADMTAAKAAEPNIVAIMSRMGVPAPGAKPG